MADNLRDPVKQESKPRAWKSLGLSVGLHVILLGLFFVGWHWTTPTPEKEPNFITARLVQEQRLPTAPHPVKQEAQAATPPAPKAKPKPEPKKPPEPTPQQKALAEKKAAEEAARQKAIALQQAKEKKAEEEKRKQDAERKKREEAKRKAEAAEKQRLAEARKKKEEEEKRQEEAKRKEQEQRLQNLVQQAQEAQKKRQAEEALKAEQERQRAAAAKAQQARALTERDKYILLIKQRVTDHWFRPPSTDSNLSTVVTIRLLPTGELISATIKDSSGNAAFDNSVLSAIRSISRFPVPDDPTVFNEYFRQLSFQFSPQGSPQ
ncbi:cell envelope integrity protein TolA [Mangrovitalea sediminis]|uniref:cell envelope integrity protein TolA n=1 Tax=Mangrovitalea sediminis TaxID=1982043 RepID=UPI0013045EB4|nr:cell envelope integrity protein TolA [Mangrovitalea sediminis]